MAGKNSVTGRWGEVNDTSREGTNYWLKKMSELSEQPSLSLDAERPTEYNGAKKNITISVPENARRRIAELTRDAPLLVYSCLLVGVAICLHKYSGADEVVIGSPKRSHPEGPDEKPNALPILVKLRPQQTVRDLLLEARQTLIEAYAWQSQLTDDLIDEHAMSPGHNRRPLFDVAVAFAGLHQVMPETKNDLTFNFLQEDGELRGIIEYNPSLFETPRIEQIYSHFERILLQMLENTDASIASLDIVTTQERRRLLTEWASAKDEKPEIEFFHALVNEWAIQAPDLVALEWGDRRLSYGGLSRRVNRLASRLQRRGVEPERFVGVSINRSIEMVIGVLAVLRAGGALVPLDPGYPQDRIAIMLDVAQPSILLTQKHHLSLYEHFDTEILCLEEEGIDEEIDEEIEEPWPPALSPENLAYLIFTSGSTGEPKGVQATHRGLSNLQKTQSANFGVGVGDRVLQLFSLNFDVSISEIVMALSGGGTLHVIEQDITPLGDQLLETIRAAEITTVSMSPSMLKTLEGRSLPVLRTLIVGGEKCSAELIALWRKRRQFFNAYGLTETSVTATIADCRNFDGTASVGRPIENVSACILGGDFSLLPIGIPGELFVGGAGIARGYVKRADWTAERFIPNPFESEPGALMYKTGDLVRYRQDGTIEFLGRIDHQVKVRGYRIEVGEIEAILKEDPRVKDALVIAEADQIGNQRLIAYATTTSDFKQTSQDLRRRLSSKLPQYMIPAHIVMLEKFPFNRNGKLDRKALPAPVGAAEEEEGPRIKVEEILVGIWKQVLWLERVGINDNFFELGGDSILSIHVITRARKAGVFLTPKQMFQYQTISELAKVAGTSDLIQAPQGLITGSAPLTPIQEWFFEQEIKNPHHFNQSLLLEIQRPVDPQTVETAITALLLHHDALRTRFCRESDRWLQVNSGETGTGIFQCINLGEIESGRREAVFSQLTDEFQASLDLQNGPLLRVGYFEMSPGESIRLLLATHHLITDAVSWRILLEDLEQVYGQLRGNKSIALPAKTTSYHQWAETLERYRSTENLQQDLDFWSAIIGRQVLSFPRDYPKGDHMETGQAELWAELSEVETERLLRETTKVYGVDLQDLLIAALVQTMTMWTGDRGLLLDLEGHGREEGVATVDLSRTVGWFTAIYPMWFPCRDGESIHQQLDAVHNLLESAPQRGLSFGVLRYLDSKSPIATDLKRGAQAEMCFNYLGQFDEMTGRDRFFRPAKGSSGAQRNPKDGRKYPFELNCGISRNRFQLRWIYSKNLHRKETIEQLSAGYLRALRVFLTPENLTPRKELDPKVSGFDDREVQKILAGVRVRPENTPS